MFLLYGDARIPATVCLVLHGDICQALVSVLISSFTLQNKFGALRAPPWPAQAAGSPLLRVLPRQAVQARDRSPPLHRMVHLFHCLTYMGTLSLTHSMTMPLRPKSQFSGHAGYINSSSKWVQIEALWGRVNVPMSPGMSHALQCGGCSGSVSGWAGIACLQLAPESGRSAARPVSWTGTWACRRAGERAMGPARVPVAVPKEQHGRWPGLPSLQYNGPRLRQ